MDICTFRKENTLSLYNLNLIKNNLKKYNNKQLNLLKYMVKFRYIKTKEYYL